MNFLKNFKIFVIISWFFYIYINCQNLKLLKDRDTINTNKNQFEIKEITHFFTEYFHNKEKFTEVKSKFFCDGCKKIFNSLVSKENYFLEKVMMFLGTEICIREKMFEKSVCEGAVTENVPHIIKSLKKRYADPDVICPFIKMCPIVYEKVDINLLVQDILKDKPKIERKIPKGENIIKILHLADPHTDIEYEEGNIAECDQPLCCRSESKNSKSDMKAGKWGTLADCDLPMKTFEQFTLFVKKSSPNLEFALWTGDNTSHDIWHQSYERNIENTREMTNILKKHLNFPIYPVMGNHESFPVDVYSYHSERELFLNSELSHIWKDWIGVPASELHKNYAFYSIYNEKFNLKTIAINTQACNNLNFYLFQDPSDPGNMLNWLRKELKDSEERNHNVYIIGHIPIYECIETWAIVYNALIERFSHIISGQFFGHDHSDSFSVSRNGNTGEINNIHFIQASLTTYGERNPSFRIYDIDRDTMIPVNYYEYRLEIDKWNNSEEENIEWALAYEFLKEYNLPDMSFKSYERLIEMLENDQETRRKFAFNQASGNARRVELNKKFQCETFTLQSLVKKCFGSSDSMTDKLFNYLENNWKKRIENDD